MTFNTLEQDSSGQSYQIRAQFRKYPSYKESLEDYADLIKNGLTGNPDFYKPTWKSETKKTTKKQPNIWKDVMLQIANIHKN